MLCCRRAGLKPAPGRPSDNGFCPDHEFRRSVAKSGKLKTHHPRMEGTIKTPRAGFLLFLAPPRLLEFKLAVTASEESLRQRPPWFPSFEQSGAATDVYREPKEISPATKSFQQSVAQNRTEHTVASILHSIFNSSRLLLRIVYEFALKQLVFSVR